MTTVIEGFYFNDLLIPFTLISSFVVFVIILTAVLVRKELGNEKHN